ncbi:hypothetical protein LXM94_11080 [Rhizobium sp. TRM95111]|uniref:hypothetical protein n=1 Tax=Rhizobium alarense TaxID=2846851 RepID=UPI001F42105F|nr:hypothetical protein [Rhizobium alarense]MCF3640506.1 hypothetical protein [Rhizobium alarense]
MASITFEHTTGPAHSVSLPLRALFSRIADAWRRHSAEQALESLPFDVMKDIGYPSVDISDRQRTAR